MLFLYGFISCWILLAIIAFIKDNMDFNSTAIDIIDVIITFPILIVAIPIYTLYRILKRQWMLVINPISIKTWEKVAKNTKYIKIKNFYICFDKKESWINKLVFVKVINKERENKYEL